MDSVAVKTRKAILALVDRRPGVYMSAEEQLTACADLLKRDALQKKARDHFVDHTAITLRNVAIQIARQANVKPDRLYGVASLFKNGSDILRPEVLTRIGYIKDNTTDARPSVDNAFEHNTPESRQEFSGIDAVSQQTAVRAHLRPTTVQEDPHIIIPAALERQNPQYQKQVLRPSLESVHAEMRNLQSLGMSDKQVAEEMHRIFNLVSTTTDQFLRNSNIDGSKPPAAATQARNQLRRLYLKLFDNQASWTARFKELRSAETITTFSLLQALVGAAIDEFVFKRQPQWSTCEALVDSQWMEKNGKYITPLLEHSGQSLVTIFHKAASDQIRDPLFVDREVRPQAEKLAANLVETLERHILKSVQDTAGAASVMGGEVAHQWVQHLEDVFKSAMILRSRLTAAKEEYDFVWPNTGEAVSRREMEELVVVKGPGEVVITLFPAVRLIPVGSGQARTVAKAQVLSQ
ncbi:hypothetical protein LTR66_005001 [Elasticomyces elasticus]|nr:hypothetical protein LTR66_005001 [Elasticomyces elasticus]